LAKTKLEKLQAIIEAAAILRDSAVVGDQEGQYSQEAVDALSKYIDSAHAVAINETSEEPQLEAEHTILVNVIKDFKGTIVKALKKEPETVELRGVVLKGADNFKKGTHSLHIGNKIVTFVDGKADVLPDLAAELEKYGFIE
jgi:hypothetical protein